MQRYLIVNPRSGTGSPSAGGAARRRARAGHRASISSGRGRTWPEVARRADADVLGMAGGDGSLAAVAEVAIEQDMPFVCIPFGTRNHFARDLGLDRDDPIGALAAFDGEERRIDVGRVGDRLFLNNVSLGLYALLVHRREHHRRRRDALARLRALALTVRDRRRRQRFTIDGEPVRARLVLVANNDYSLDLLLARRARADRRRAAPPLRPARLPPHHVGRAERTELEIGSPLTRGPGRDRRRAGRARHAASSSGSSRGALRVLVPRAPECVATRDVAERTRARRRPGSSSGANQRSSTRSSAARSNAARDARVQVRERTVRPWSYRLHPDAEELRRLDLEPGLLAQLADGARRVDARSPRGTRRACPTARRPGS